MTLRIAVALFAAIRAALIYGEASRLTTQPLELPRLRRAAPRPAPVVALSPPAGGGPASA
jgi:hypothetical protein